MHYRNAFILILTLHTGLCAAGALPTTAPPFQWPALTPTSIEKLKKGEVVVEADVNTIPGPVVKEKKQDRQTLSFYTAGLHPRTCTQAMRKLSRYELYPQWLDFVKEAAYDEKLGRVKFLLVHTLLPFKIQIDLKLPRITGPGTYAYSFDKGFVKDLGGNIVLSEDESLPLKERRCLFYATASWEGPYSGIPDSVFELFSTALTRVAMEKLFRLSSVGP